MRGKPIVLVVMLEEAMLTVCTATAGTNQTTMRWLDNCSDEVSDTTHWILYLIFEHPKGVADTNSMADEKQLVEQIEL